MRRCGRLSNQWNVWLKEPNTNARVVSDFPQTKLRTSSTSVNFKSKRRNAPTAVKPSIVLITWRSTWEVVRRLLRTLANGNYVKQLWMDPLHWRMDPPLLEMDGGGGPSRWCTCWTCWTLEGTWNKRVCLKVHGYHLQEGVRQQQQKIHPAAIERGYS